MSLFPAESDPPAGPSTPALAVSVHSHNLQFDPNVHVAPIAVLRTSRLKNYTLTHSLTSRLPSSVNLCNASAAPFAIDATNEPHFNVASED
jgi:hypothetical protein